MSVEDKEREVHRLSLFKNYRMEKWGIINRGGWEEVTGGEESKKTVVSPKSAKKGKNLVEIFPLLASLTSILSICKYFWHHSDMVLFIIRPYNLESFITFRIKSIILRL